MNSLYTHCRHCLLIGQGGQRIGRFSPLLPFLLLLLIFLTAVACQESAAPTAPASRTELSPTATPAPATVAATLTPTPQPSPTPRPLAATVNGRPLYDDLYEAELARYRQWYYLRGPDGRDVRVYVLELLLDQMVIGQAAAEAGVSVPPDVLEAALAQAVADSGGAEAYRVWLEKNHFSEEAFRAQVAAELLTQAMIAHVTQDVPASADFLRARYIQVADPELAQSLLARLREGADFADLARRHSLDPARDLRGGDLGWFTHGTLTVPELEAAAFALPLNSVSEVISASRTNGSQSWYLIEVTAREEGRPLSADQYAERLQERFENWLAERRASADIEVMIGFD
jgi:hypothetical protein